MDLRQRWQASIMPTYAPPSISAVRGAGAVIWDEGGNSYVDMLGGIAVNALGHAHPAVVAAVTKQIGTLGHVSNLVASAPAVNLAERLLAIAAHPASGTVFFANSGAEANEAALKLARRTGRPRIVTAVDGFHGRTMGALSLTGQPAKQAPFSPMLTDIVHVPFGDIAALRAAIDERTAMVLLEPIQGEAGVVAAPPGYLAAARELTTAAGALLAVDEVQTGIGRTGAWFAYQHAGIAPDVVTLAKGLGGGLPIGACLAFGPAAQLMRPGEHGSTFGGNPICAAASLAVLDVVEREKLAGRADELGQFISAGVLGLHHPLVHGIRGAGLLLGIALTQPVAAEVAVAMLKRGFLVNAVAADVIRIAPPLVLEPEQAADFVRAFAASLGAVSTESPATATNISTDYQDE